MNALRQALADRLQLRRSLGHQMKEADRRVGAHQASSVQSMIPRALFVSSDNATSVGAGVAGASVGA